MEANKSNYHLTNPDTKQEVINRLALNENQSNIGNDVGITRQSISTFKKRNIKAIEFVREQMIADNLDNMMTSVRTDLSNNNKLSELFRDYEQIKPELIAYKSSIQKNILKPLLESTGIFQSHTINNNFGTINNQTNNVQVNAPIAKLIGDKCLEQLVEAGNDEVEYDDIC